MNKTNITQELIDSLEDQMYYWCWSKGKITRPKLLRHDNLNNLMVIDEYHNSEINDFSFIHPDPVKEPTVPLG